MKALKQLFPISLVMFSLTFYLSGCGSDPTPAETSGGGSSNSSSFLMGGSIQGTELNLVTAVTTLAGLATVSTPTGQDGTGTNARFALPYGITTDGTNLYIGDSGHLNIRKVVIATGVVTTLAGQAGTSGTTDATGTAARFQEPYGVTTDGTNVYVCDRGNHSIRQVVIATGVVTTIAGTSGTGNAGSTDATGAAASFSSPDGITTDGTNLYVSDTANNLIRQIVISTGVVTTLAGSGASGTADGTGTAATFSSPRLITTDGTNLYVVGSAVIRQIVISTAVVTTLAGSGSLGSTDDIGTAAEFNFPKGVATDGTNLYIGDSSNHTIRKIVISTGEVTTLAGTVSTTGSTDATGTSALFNFPRGITTDGTNLFIAEWINHTVRKME